MAHWFILHNYISGIPVKSAHLLPSKIWEFSHVWWWTPGISTEPCGIWWLLDALLLVPLWWSPTWRGASLILYCSGHHSTLPHKSFSSTSSQTLQPPTVLVVWNKSSDVFLGNQWFLYFSCIPSKGRLRWPRQGNGWEQDFRSNPMGHAIKYPASGSYQSLYRPGEEYGVCTTSSKNHRMLRFGRELKDHPSLPWAGTLLSWPGWTCSAPKYLQVRDFLSQTWLPEVPFGEFLLLWSSSTSSASWSWDRSPPVQAGNGERWKSSSPLCSSFTDWPKSVPSPSILLSTANSQVSNKVKSHPCFTTRHQHALAAPLHFRGSC